MWRGCIEELFWMSPPKMETRNRARLSIISSLSNQFVSLAKTVASVSGKSIRILPPLRHISCPRIIVCIRSQWRRDSNSRTVTQGYSQPVDTGDECVSANGGHTGIRTRSLAVPRCRVAVCGLARHEKQGKGVIPMHIGIQD
jgi:hypothetical protein